MKRVVGRLVFERKHTLISRSGQLKAWNVWAWRAALPFFMALGLLMLLAMHVGWKIGDAGDWLDDMLGSRW